MEEKLSPAGRWVVQLLQSHFLSFCNEHGWHLCRSAGALISTEIRHFNRDMYIQLTTCSCVSQVANYVFSSDCSENQSNVLFLLVLFILQDGCSSVPPPPSCLCDASVLLAAILRYTQDSTAAASMKIEALLQVWANLVADWNAWEEQEDESVFDSIEEAVALQVCSNLFCIFIISWFKSFCISGMKLMHMNS